MYSVIRREINFTLASNRLADFHRIAAVHKGTHLVIHFTCVSVHFLVEYDTRNKEIRLSMLNANPTALRQRLSIESFVCFVYYINPTQAKVFLLESRTTSNNFSL